MKKHVLVCVLLVCAVSTATNASAQITSMTIARRAGIGASAGGIFPVDDDVSAGAAFGVVAGLAPQSGFGPTIGFGWYRADLMLPGLAGEAEVARLRVRPLMAGIGYTWVAGRVATGVSINAGVSFNSIRVDDAFRASFGPGAQVQADVSNSFAMRPQLRVEYEVARKVGVYSSLGYFFTDIDTSIDTPAGRFENQWDGNSINIFVGVMIYPFR